MTTEKIKQAAQKAVDNAARMKAIHERLDSKAKKARLDSVSDKGARVVEYATRKGAMSSEEREERAFDLFVRLVHAVEGIHLALSVSHRADVQHVVDVLERGVDATVDLPRAQIAAMIRAMPQMTEATLGMVDALQAKMGARLDRPATRAARAPSRRRR